MIAEQHVLALPAGYQLGKYIFKGLLGSGGFGITYLAEDTSLDRKVAINEMLPNEFATRLGGTTVVAKTRSDKTDLEWARARFVDEGRALAACDHPNVIDVYEMIEANGTAYMVTKYEEGCNLESWLQKLGRRPTEPELKDILFPLLSGLERVHRTGFLHRDIKPENIYITEDGRPVLLDFGSARQAIRRRSVVMTSIITPGYAPFEQYYEDGNQGEWTDIYALGAVIYRALTGKRPPEAIRRLADDSCERLAVAYNGRYSDGFLTALTVR
jgi:serine/threonine protein kinase